VSVSARFIEDLLVAELSGVSDPRVLQHIRSLLIRPEPQMRAWDYGGANDAYPCWIALADEKSNTAIAYCEFGFGPTNPWGLLRLAGSEHMSMGMDSGWFGHFLDAYFESVASDLPIWRVFQYTESSVARIPVTEEASWDETWKKVMRLRREKPDRRFDCWQTIHSGAGRT
jgi:hypothetical protein